MATISSSGIGSGLDVNSIISQLMTIEKQPLTVLDTKEASFQAKLTTYGTLKSAVAAVQTAARALKSSTLYNSMSATTGNSALFSASANTAAQAGSYSLEVLARAEAQSLSSKGFSSITSDLLPALGGDGKIKIELGSFSGGLFAADASKTATTIDIPEASSSLSDIRDAINAANAGVRASLVYVGGSTSDYKLTLTSTETGAKNSIKLTVLNASGVVQTDNLGLAQLSFDPAAATGTGKELTANTPAQDAHIQIDKLDVYRSSNTISDAITGVSLNLAGLGTTTLTVSKDKTSASTAMEAFVTAYNDLNTQLTTATVYNSTTKLGAVLTGDSGARSLQSSLREMIGQSRKTVGSAYATLSDLGVALQRDGSLVFNSSKFAAAMASSTTNVGDLLSSTSTSLPGLAVRMSTTLDGILSNTGILASRTDGINRSVTDITNQRTRLNARLVTIEAAYRKQYSALDSLIASMQQTSAYLTQQLATLASTTKSA